MMQNSRLVHIIKSFSSKEVLDFRKWITSPAHNTRQDIILLFEYLTAGEHLFKDKFLQKERIYAKVYPKEVFDDAKMRQVIHFLTKTIENFLIYRELLSDEVRAKITLASVYRKRRLDKSCERMIKSSEQILQKNPYKNGDFLRNRYFLQQERYSYLSGFQRTELNLQEMSDSLDATYFADKLRQCCLMLSHQSVYKTEYKVGLIEETLQHIEQSNYLEYPAIAVYYFVYKTLVYPDEESYFYSLKEEMEEHGGEFPIYETRNIYLMAINYCIKKMNKGKKSFIREAFELYRLGIEKGFLIENGHISRMTFLNIVINGTQLKEFDWVEYFISDYQAFIRENHRENIANYSFAKLYYEKGDYDSSMKYLVQYEYDDIILNLNSKNMLLKMLYEQGEFDALESLVGNMSAYLKRKKVIGYHKLGYSNLISLARKLIRINPYDKAERGKLKSEIETTQPLTTSNKKWLLDQVAKL